MFEARLGPRLRVGDLAPPAGFLSNVDPAPDEILRDSEVWAALSTSYIYIYGLWSRKAFELQLAEPPD